MHEVKSKEIDPKVLDYRIALVGNPNVGKSVLFGLFTGKYVTVSNYPGTTVEVTRGMYSGSNDTIEVVDTPGSNSLISHSEDERVARDILLRDEEKRVIQIIDSKNIHRGLLITTQLAEMGLPVSIGLNMWDETLDRGMSIDSDKLQKILGVTLTKTIATQKYGIGALRNSINSVKIPKISIDYGRVIEEGIKEIETLLPENTTVRKRALAVMLLSYDEDLEETLEIDEQTLGQIHSIRDGVQKEYGHPLSYVIAKKRSDYVGKLLKGIVSYREHEEKAGAVLRNSFFLFFMPLFTFFVGYKVIDLLMFMFAGHMDTSGQVAWILRLAGGCVSVGIYSYYLFSREYGSGRKVTNILGTLTMHPVLAWPMLLVVLWCIYKIVGQFGAGDCVDFVESKIFGSSIEKSGGFDFKAFIPFTNIEYVFTHVNFQGINYYIGLFCQKFMSTDNFFFELFMGEEAGLIQVGVTYSIAIILPIVGFFFISFGLMEDSGYLPRLAVMLNRFFKIIGLNGKAVLPMVLGLGCDTMATMTTRILDTKKERVISTLLLALAVPCSAQLGVIAGILGSVSGTHLAIYFFVIFSQMLLVGYLSSKIIKGSSSDFLMEMPPFRRPKIGNILMKTYYRTKWFLREAVPLFVLGTFILFIITKLGILTYIQRAAEPVVKHFLGLPVETTQGFILGFLRRDYAVVSIFKALEKDAGSLEIDPNQLIVSLVVVTLFVPCLANFFVMIKERGSKTAFLMLAFILPFSFLVGGIVRYALQLLSI
ncbi:Fe2+ transport system protein B [Candidatus Scalindua japonica]|uniref:Fe2+ transport system protein B n=1 Tax=Candidatus Scalindua japonica TaxID=1284222 RepID=A0A286TUY8_9BACT|nr:ferrous iron transporter B [Candidatus Scalindua japonica]GAX59655.1 Fe2+ transport system protein B [Candidatus Scalindua japonica]